VFAGGFDLAGACAVNRSDYLTILDLLDALVRKSLLVKPTNHPGARLQAIDFRAPACRCARRIDALATLDRRRA